MLNLLKQNIDLFVIRKALRKPAPNTIPLTGDATKHRNVYSVYLSIEGDRKFLVKSLQKQCVEGIWYDDDQEEIQYASVPLRNLKFYKIDITQYFNDLVLRYPSSVHFIIGHLLQAARISWFRNWATQTVYNQRTISRSDRIQVLKLLLNKKIESPNQPTNIIDLICMIHGERWVLRPDSENIRNYYKVILNALVQKGDILKVEFGYHLKDQAFNTIAEFETDERKHKDTVALQSAIVFLTFALVILGVFNLIADLYTFIRS